MGLLLRDERCSSQLICVKRLTVVYCISVYMIDLDHITKYLLYEHVWHIYVL